MAKELLADTRDNLSFFQDKTLIGHITSFVHSLFFFCTIKITVKGLENVPQTGGAIVAANHQSNYDPILMLCKIPRHLVFMTKEEMFKNPILGAYYRRLGGFPVKRNGKDRWAIDYTHHKILTKDRVLGIFPEGHRSETGRLQAGKIGTAFMAIRANCPIIPVAIVGTPQILKHFPKRIAVTFTVGTPIYPQANESPKVLIERVMLAIAKMLPPEMRGVYGRGEQ